MVDPCPERHLGRLERVLGRKVDVKEEHAAFVHRAWRAQDGRNPLVNVVTLGAGAEK